MPSPFGIYVHVPWCRVRCPYCAFNVYPDRGADWGRWTAGILGEWRLRAGAWPGQAHSLYLGGGTPSLAPPEAIAGLIDALPLEPGAEITLEVNPGTATEVRLRAFIQAGVNRLSLGIQTFNPRFAHLLNRGHTVGDARELVGMVGSLPLRSWSFDLIFALPGQSLGDLQEDLDAIVALAPPHVSLYGLTFEEGTPFHRALLVGKMQEPDEEGWRAQYERIVGTLQAHGWERYEVSNFARPGHRAVHNEAVWKGGFYAGLGPGAHGFQPDGLRTENHRGIEDWLGDPLGRVERPSQREAAADRLLSNLRHIEGLDRARLGRDFGFEPDPVLVRAMVGAGLLSEAGPLLRLTDAGVPLADGVVRRLSAALVPLDPETRLARPVAPGRRLDKGGRLS